MSRPPRHHPPRKIYQHKNACPEDDWPAEMTTDEYAAMITDFAVNSVGEPIRDVETKFQSQFCGNLYGYHAEGLVEFNPVTRQTTFLIEHSGLGEIMVVVG